jgi:predicted nucleic acid-binding protein
VTVVLDTSVVLNLCLLGREALLSSLYERVLAPPAVKDEFQALAAGDPRFAGLRFPGFVDVVVPDESPRTGPSMAHLQSGEVAAILLALQLRSDAVLMDERAGRIVASSLGLRPLGLLGVLLDGKRQGLVSAIGPLLDRLDKKAGFWIAPSLRSAILTEAGES